MKFSETRLAGVYIVEPEQLADERGFFARTWCKQEFASHGLNSELVQCSISFNNVGGTLRGMHYQQAPYAEDKLVRCTMGAIYDVALDLRKESPTYKQWVGVELSSDNRRMLYIPVGVAHGFQTLVDSTEVFYQMSQFYRAGSGAGVRWNDPAFGIEWPDVTARILSERDSLYPDFNG